MFRARIFILTTSVGLSDARTASHSSTATWKTEICRSTTKDTPPNKKSGYFSCLILIFKKFKTGSPHQVNGNYTWYNYSIYCISVTKSFYCSLFKRIYENVQFIRYFPGFPIREGCLRQIFGIIPTDLFFFLEPSLRTPVFAFFEKIVPFV